MSQVSTMITPTMINNIPETTLIMRITFGVEIKLFTLERHKIISKFPNIGIENEVMEMMNKSREPIFLKSKNPGSNVK